MKTLFTTLFTFFALAVAPAEAQFGFGDNMASAEACLRRVGDEVQVMVRFSIEPGWHLYHNDLGDGEAIARPTEVEVLLEGVEWEPLLMSEPERYDDKLNGTWAYVHHDTATAYLKGRLVDQSATVEDAEVSIVALTCTSGGDGTCIPYEETILAETCDHEGFSDWPTDAQWSKALTAGAMGSGGGGGEPSGGVMSGGVGERIDVRDERWEEVAFPEYDPADPEKSYSLGMWLLFAFLAGMILNVMPCVLPVVSIKVLSFVQQAGESKKRVFSLGLAFAAGIMAVFVVLAILGYQGSGWGEQFQDERFLVVMIAIVFAFALSMFNVFHIGVPSSVGSMAAGPPKEGLRDAFFKGVLATVLATPCSGPFLGSTLAWALAQPPVTVFLIFIMIGLGMALPYVVLTANPKLLKLVPKPGPWMETFKQFMGFVLLGTVIYLMTSVRQDLLIYTVNFLVFVALGCWVWGRWATFDQTTAKRLGTAAAAIGFIVFGAFFSYKTMRNFYEGVGEGEGHLAWVDFDPDALQRYHDEGRSVFVDFTANWCPNCKYNEKFVFESEPVREVIDRKDVVCMKADETDRTPYTEMIKRLRNKLGGRSIPFLAVFPGDRPTEPIVKLDVVTKEGMIEVFESLPEPQERHGAVDESRPRTAGIGPSVPATR